MWPKGKVFRISTLKNGVNGALWKKKEDLNRSEVGEKDQTTRSESGWLLCLQSEATGSLGNNFTEGKRLGRPS